MVNYSRRVAFTICPFCNDALLRRVIFFLRNKILFLGKTIPILRIQLEMKNTPLQRPLFLSWNNKWKERERGERSFANLNVRWEVIRYKFSLSLIFFLFVFSTTSNSFLPLFVISVSFCFCSICLPELPTI